MVKTDSGGIARDDPDLRRGSSSGSNEKFNVHIVSFASFVRMYCVQWKSNTGGG